MNDLGIFFSAFNETRAVDFSIASIKNIYPDIPIFLVSDGGENFDFISNKYTNVKVYAGIDTMSNTFKITDKNFKETQHQEAIITCISTLFSRLEKAIEFCNSQYIMMFDPDTLLRGQITIPNYAKLLGTRLNSDANVITEDYKNILLSIGVKPITCWGATPTIFEVVAFRRALYKLSCIPELLQALCMSSYAMFAHDFLFPTLFSLIGEIEHFNPEITECTRNPIWQSSGHPILHQYKFLY